MTPLPLTVAVVYALSMLYVLLAKNLNQEQVLDTLEKLQADVEVDNKAAPPASNALTEQNLTEPRHGDSPTKTANPQNKNKPTPVNRPIQP